MTRRLLTILGLLAVALLPAPRAYACSCVAEPGSDGPLEGTVFYGEVLSREESRNRAVYTVRVERVYAGEVGPVAHVHTSAHGASCGLEIPGSGLAVLWTREREGRLESSLCSRTRSVAGPPTTLGEGKPPAAASPTSAPSGSGERETVPGTDTGALPVAATFAAVGLGLLVTRRRR